MKIARPLLASTARPPSSPHAALSQPETTSRVAAAIDHLPALEAPLPDACLIEDAPHRYVQQLGGPWRKRTTTEGEKGRHSFDTEVALPDQWALHGGDLFTHGGPVSYSRSLIVSPEMVAQDRVPRLCFESVDHVADVFLNGALIGHHEGGADPFEIDVRGRLHADRPNDLTVRVSTPLDPGAPVFKEQIRGVFGQHDSRPGAPFPASLGGASNVGTTGGIVGAVTLVSTGLERVEGVMVATSVRDDGHTADLTFTHRLGNETAVPRDVTVEVTWKPVGDDDPARVRRVSKAVTLAPGAHEVQLSGVEPQARLWWTHDLGEPALYAMESRVVEADGTVSDVRRQRFGIRELTYDPRSARLSLNGVSLFQRGINYVAGEWLSRLDTADYTADLRQMREANLNAVRVHGMVLPDAFYDAADAAGMLVWADFPLHWGQSTGRAFSDQASHQVQSMVERLQHHPSIWTWCMHNEPFPHDAPLDHRLAREAAAIDPTRPVLRESSFFTHFYPGWYPGFPFDYKGIRCYSPTMAAEYGPQGVSASMRDVIGSAWPPDRDAWAFHNLQWGPTEAHLGPPAEHASVDAFIALSQRYQADAVRYMTEYFRRRKYAPTALAYPYAFKDPWPAVGWGVVDHAGTPKRAYAALRESMAPLLLSVDWSRNVYRPGETVKAPLHLVNDTQDAPRGEVTWTVRRRNAPQVELAHGTSAVEVPRDGVAQAATAFFTLPPGTPRGEQFVLWATFRDASGTVRAETHHLFGTAPAKAVRYTPAWLDADEAEAFSVALRTPSTTAP